MPCRSTAEGAVESTWLRGAGKCGSKLKMKGFGRDLAWMKDDRKLFLGSLERLKWFSGCILLKNILAVDLDPKHHAKF